MPKRKTTATAKGKTDGTCLRDEQRRRYSVPAAASARVA